jgi:hypothetical protein
VALSPLTRRCSSEGGTSLAGRYPIAYQAGLKEERAALIAKFDQAIRLDEELERQPDPHGPIGATILDERTGVEIARELQTALADVDAEITRVG